uniref:Uncharacterized protein n=1 Tax=Arundo donax TaxID=35708 RepID=A0A0A9CFW0_ARUDO
MLFSLQRDQDDLRRPRSRHTPRKGQAPRGPAPTPRRWRRLLHRAVARRAARGDQQHGRVAQARTRRRLRHHLQGRPPPP